MSALLQMTLKTECYRELILLSWEVGSKFHPGFEWAKCSSDSMRVLHFNGMSYKDSPVFDTKFIIKSYFC